MHVDATDSWRQEFPSYYRVSLAAGRPWSEIVAKRTAMLPHVVFRAYHGFVPTKDGLIAISAGGRPMQPRLIKLKLCPVPSMSTRLSR